MRLIRACGELWIASQKYRFHCADGHTAIIDEKGVKLPNAGLLWRHAERAAWQVMELTGRNLDWSDWVVDVHDGAGRHVMTLGFTDVVNVPTAA